MSNEAVSNTDAAGSSSGGDKSKVTQRKDPAPKKIPPVITDSKWIIDLRKENEKNYTNENTVVIKQARTETETDDKKKTKVKIRLTVKEDKDNKIGSGIPIIILGLDEVKKVTATRENDSNLFYSEDITIEEGWLNKELQIKVKLEEPFKEEHLGSKLAIVNDFRVYPVRWGIHYEEKNTLKSGEPKYKCTNCGDKKDSPTVKDAEIKNYKYYPMPLRSGYVYVYENDKSDQGVLEFLYDETKDTFEETNNYFNLTPPWRISDGNAYLSVNGIEKKNLSLFYSEVQLTPASVNALITDAKLVHELSEKSRMMFVKDLAIFHQEQGIGAYNESRLKGIVKEAKLYNSKAQYKDIDVFFIVDDTMGVAKQIAWYVEDKHNDHECFIRSIKTGENFNEIKKNKDKVYDIDDYRKLMYPKRFDSTQNRLEHFVAVHDLGKLINQIFNINYKKYKEYSFIEEAKGKIDEDMLKEYLAVKERKDLRNQIDEFRKDLKTCINSDSFQSLCAFFEQLKPPAKQDEKEAFFTMLLDIKILVAKLHVTLSNVPHLKDMDIDGEPSNYDSIDPYSEFLKKTTDQSSWKLLSKELNFLELKNKGKCVSYIDKVLLLPYLLNAATRILKGGKINDNNKKIIENNTWLGFCSVNMEVLKRELKKDEEAAVRDIVLDYGKSLWSSALDVDKIEEFIGKDVLRKMPIFRILQGMYAIYTLKEVFEQDNSIDKAATGGKFLLSIGALVSKIGQDAHTISLKAEEMTVSKAVAKGLMWKELQKLLIMESVVGLVGTAYECYQIMCKSSDRKQHDDADAAALYAVCAAFTLAAGLWGAKALSIMSISAAGGPGVLILGFIAASCIFAAQVATDTPLEEFLVKTIFGKKMSVFHDQVEKFVYTKNTSINAYYKNINTIGTAYSTYRVIDKPWSYLADYKFMLEEFMLNHLVVVNLDVKYTEIDYYERDAARHKPRANVTFIFKIYSLYCDIEKLEIDPTYFYYYTDSNNMSWLKDFSLTQKTDPKNRHDKKTNSYCRFAYTLTYDPTNRHDRNVELLINEEAFVETFLSIKLKNAQIGQSFPSEGKFLMTSHEIKIGSASGYNAKKYDCGAPKVALKKVKIVKSKTDFNYDEKSSDTTAEQQWMERNNDGYIQVKWEEKKRPDSPSAGYKEDVYPDNSDTDSQKNCRWVENREGGGGTDVCD